MSAYTRRSRITGGLLTVGRADELGLSDEGGRWVTVCEEHSTIANSATRELARIANGLDFCDGCREWAKSEADALERMREALDGLRAGLSGLVAAFEEASKIIEIIVEGGRPRIEIRPIPEIEIGEIVTFGLGDLCQCHHERERHSSTFGHCFYCSCRSFELADAPGRDGLGYGR